MGADEFAERVSKFVQAGVIRLPENFADLPPNQTGDALLRALRKARRQSSGRPLATVRPGASPTHSQAGWHDPRREGARHRPSQRLPLRAAVQGGHRAAAAPVRHRPPRRGAAMQPVPGGGRRLRQLFAPEPALRRRLPQRLHASVLGTTPAAAS